MDKDLNFQDWNEFFKELPFTFFRTSLIQQKYISIIDKYTPPDGKLLEIAAGSGYTSAIVSDLVRKKRAKITISDIEPELLNAASTKFGTFNMHYIQSDSLNLKQFKDDEFDIVFHQGFLEHFPDETIINLLQQQARISKQIIFDVPNGRRWDKTQEFGNERFLAHKKWLSITKEAGLKIDFDTARRFTNRWKKWVPVSLQNSEWFHRKFGETSIVVCSKYTP